MRKWTLTEAHLILVSCTMFLLVASSSASLGGPLYNPNAKVTSLFSDQVAGQVGDVITIKVVESLTSKKKNSLKSDKEFSIKDGTGFIEFIETLGFRGSAGLSGKEERNVSAEESLLTTISARVVEVLPNGDLRVEGGREFGVNGEKQAFKVSGVVRPKDLDSTNTVSSTKVADFRMEVKGKPARPGIITTILKLLF